MKKIFITGHTPNLITRLCITSTWPFDIPVEKKNRKIFADRSISLKFERMIANELRKIFTITKNYCVKHENSTKREIRLNLLHALLFLF